MMNESFWFLLWNPRVHENKQSYANINQESTFFQIGDY